MSKVIYLALPAYGHTYPALGLVNELIKKGERVIFYTDDKFRELIASTGAEFRNYKGALTNTITAQEYEIMRKPSGTFEQMVAMGTGMIKDMKDIFDRIFDEVKADNPDYILHDSFAFWGKPMAEALDIPGITCFCVFAYSEKVVEKDPVMFLRNILRLTPEEIEKELKRGGPVKQLEVVSRFIRNRYGLKDFKILDCVNGGREPLNIVFTSREFQAYADCFDESYKFVGPSIRPVDVYVEFPMDRLTGEKPLIYVSMGTQIVKQPEFLKRCITAFQDREVQVVMSLGGKMEIEELGEIPKNFIVKKYVPQLKILNRASAFITHGGLNGTSESIYYHVPMLVFPHATDQFIIAEQVEQLGLGVYVRNHEINPYDLWELTLKLLSNPVYKIKCAEIAGSFQKAGGYQKAVEEILSYIKQFSRVTSNY